MQEKAIREWAKSVGHQIVRWKRQEGESGSNGPDTREGRAGGLSGSAAPKPSPLRNLKDAGRGAGVACHVGWLEVAGRVRGHDRAPVVSEGKARRTSPALIRSGIS